MKFPRFFKHETGFANDALYLRFDSPASNARVITKDGAARQPHDQFYLHNACASTGGNGLVEISETEAKALEKS